jgi:hypothetical protein
MTSHLCAKMASAETRPLSAGIQPEIEEISRGGSDERFLVEGERGALL